MSFTMRSLGRKAEGERLERIKASPLWTGERFRNLHPIIAGLRDPTVSMPTLGDFLRGGERAHLEAWGVRPERIVELEWWESHQVPNTGLTVTAAPSRHFSGRTLQRSRCRKRCPGRSTSSA